MAISESPHQVLGVASELLGLIPQADPRFVVGRLAAGSLSRCVIGNRHTTTTPSARG
jgi:hypothetical protein